MSRRELGRVEVLARVRSRQLRVVDAARLMHVSYRQAKRLWKRYREEGAGGLKHWGAGRRSNRAQPGRFRRKVLRLVREKYGGAVGECFGPTLAAEHLASEDGLRVDPACGTAAVDAGRRVVEPGAEAAAAPPPARAPGAFWGDGAVGRQLSPLAGGARPRGLLDGPGR